MEDLIQDLTYSETDVQESVKVNKTNLPGENKLKLHKQCIS